MASKYFRKFLALTLALVMVLAFSSCKKQDENNGSQTESSQTQSGTSDIVDSSDTQGNSSDNATSQGTVTTETGYVFTGIDGSAMFDGSTSTHWFPENYEKSVIEFTSDFTTGHSE